MAIGPYALIGILLGASLIVAYRVKAHKVEGYEPRLTDAAGVFLSGYLIVTGARLGILAVFAEDMGALRYGDRVYIVLGGLVLMWVGYEGARRTIGSIRGTEIEDEKLKQQT